MIRWRPRAKPRMASDSRPVVPNPDPTTATWQALGRESRADRDYVDAQVHRLEERLAATAREYEQLAARVNQTPSVVQVEISHVRERIELEMAQVRQQFVDAGANRDRVQERTDLQVNVIQGQLTSMDREWERELASHKGAVEFAFAASKEAVEKQELANAKAIDKSERATTETISKNAALARASVSGLETQLIDLKERLVKLEALRAGGRETLTGVYALLGAIATIMAISGAVLALR